MYYVCIVVHNITILLVLKNQSQTYYKFKIIYTTSIILKNPK